MNTSPRLELFGPETTFHHVGLIVASVAKVAPADSVVFEDPVQQVRVAFVDLDGVSIEYIEPLGEDSPAAGSLKRGHKLAHLCFEVADLSTAIEQAATHGFRLVAEPVAAVAFNGRQIAWLFSADYGLVELLAKSIQA